MNINKFGNKKRRTILYVTGLVLLMLIVVWFVLGGLLFVDYKQYDRTALDNDTSPIVFSLEIHETYNTGEYPGFISWSFTDAPYKLYFYTHVDIDSPYEKLIIQEIRVTYPDGSTKQVCRKKRVHIPLKNIEDKYDPKKYTRGGRPEDMEEIYWVTYLSPCDLQLDFDQHISCNIMLKGILLDSNGKKTLVSISASFKRVRKRHIVPLNISRNSV